MPIKPLPLPVKNPSGTLKRRLIGMIKLALVCLCGLFILFGLGMAALMLWVRHDVRAGCVENCRVQKMKFPEQRVDALIACARDANRTLSEKNRTIWAMGYMNDERLVPVLKTLRTADGKCDHVRFVCQKELEKALDKMRRERLTAFYR